MDANVIYNLKFFFCLVLIIFTVDRCFCLLQLYVFVSDRERNSQSDTQTPALRATAGRKQASRTAGGLPRVAACTVKMNFLMPFQVCIAAIQENFKIPNSCTV